MQCNDIVEGEYELMSFFFLFFLTLGFFFDFNSCERQAQVLKEWNKWHARPTRTPDCPSPSDLIL
jgi:hypothetical protein